MTGSVTSKRLVHLYADWLIKNSSEEDLGAGWIELTLPFLDRHNDYCQIYVQPRVNGYYLTDDKATIRDLIQAGCLLNTPKRKYLAECILSSLGIDLNVLKTEEIFSEASEQSFPEDLQSVLQAMLAFGGLANTAPSTVESIFKEDVLMWLGQLRPNFETDVKYEGISGLTHTFDFRLPPSDSKPEQILQSISTPDRPHIQSFAFSALDTLEARGKNTEVFAVLNDKRKLNTKLTGALLKSRVTPLKWSKRDQFERRIAV